MIQNATRQASLSSLRRFWWWRVSGPQTKHSEKAIDPVAGLNLEDFDGNLVVRNWRKGGWAKAGFPMPGSDFLEAAFRYEVQARHTQKQQVALGPIYHLGQAFPLLSQADKERLKAKYPSLFLVCLPRIQDLRKCLNDPRYARYLQEVAGREDAAEVESWFGINLRTMRNADLIASFERHLRTQRERTGIKEPVRRQKHYPWATMELADKWLGGRKLESYEIERARQLLNRYGKQSF
jgi:hypothetical protein